MTIYRNNDADIYKLLQPNKKGPCLIGRGLDIISKEIT